MIRGLSEVGFMVCVSSGEQGIRLWRSFVGLVGFAIGQASGIIDLGMI